MGTLQQELTKLQTLDNMSFDDDPTPTPPLTQENTVVTSAVARAIEKSKRQIIWEWVRDHPSSSAREIADAFSSDQQSVATILTKFTTKGIVTRTKHKGVFCYTATSTEYPVMSMEEKVTRMLEGRGKRKPYRTKRTRAHASEKLPKPTLEEKKAAFYSAAPTAPLPPNLRFTASVSELLNTLSITQARALYDELKKVFGG